MSTPKSKHIAYCKHVLTNGQILANEMRLVYLLEMDTYHLLLEDKEIETDFEKIDCFRDAIEMYCEENPEGVDNFLIELQDLINEQ